MIIKTLAEYFWVVGLSLVVVGATKMFSDPTGILISGVILYVVALIIKFSLKNESKETNKKLDRLIKISNKINKQTIKIDKKRKKQSKGKNNLK